MSADQMAIIARLKASNAELDLRPELKGKKLVLPFDLPGSESICLCKVQDAVGLNMCNGCGHAMCCW